MVMLKPTVIYSTLAIVVVTIACCMVNAGGGKEGRNNVSHSALLPHFNCSDAVVP